MAASFGMAASYFVNPYAAYAATNGSHVVRVFSFVLGAKSNPISCESSLKTSTESLPNEFKWACRS